MHTYINHFTIYLTILILHQKLKLDNFPQIISNSTSAHFNENSINTPIQSNSKAPQIYKPLSPIKQKSPIIDENSQLNVTPKSSKINRDGIVLKHNVSNEFLNPNNLSPICTSLKSSPVANNDEDDDMFSTNDKNNDNNHDNGLHNILEEDSTEIDSEGFNKRKRDSFDNLSMISIDSMAPTFNSAKKPKLNRTGSITRCLRRSMSFVALKNPITNIIRSRRNSVDPNSSIGSITSIESTLNESIRKPVKEKMRTLQNRFMKGTKKDLYIMPKTPTIDEAVYTTTPKRMLSTSTKLNRTIKNSTTEDVCDFKTPLAPSSNQSYQLLSSSSSHQCPTTSTHNKECITTTRNSEASNTEDITVATLLAPIDTKPMDDHKLFGNVTSDNVNVVFLVFSFLPNTYK